MHLRGESSFAFQWDISPLNHMRRLVLYLLNRISFSALVLSLVMVLSSVPCFADVMIDPGTGLSSSYFAWNDGLGQIDEIENSTSETYWGINLSQASTIDIEAWDDFVVGDEFQLYVDDIAVAWDSTETDIDGYFHGLMDDLLLSAGYHTFTLYLTELAEDYTEGGAYISFSSATATPIPGAVWLLGSGLVGLVGLRRKAQK